MADSGILESRNLTLSLLSENDFNIIFPLMNRPEILDTMVLHYPLDREEWYDIFKNNPEKAAQGKEFGFMITLKKNKKIAGMCDLLDVNEKREKAELGYWISPEFRKQGIAFDACKLLIEYGFSHVGLHKIWAETFSTNTPSQGLLEKLGFRKVGILEKEVFKHGMWRDRVLYELLNPES
ncbi:MAG: GNAT family N-acetyltransferase [Spirochaetales bacterium]|nr:GNAT family N-acetyltransferase [Spirochaetales bacterium]